MRYFFFDASALGKNYVPEPGSDKVSALFKRASSTQFVCLTLGVGEAIWIIQRKCNDGRMQPQDAARAIDALRLEVLATPDFRKLQMTDDAVVPGFAYIHKHSLNPVDAVLLNAVLHLLGEVGRSDTVTLVAADDRLLRAARAEGIETFDPEHDTAERLDAPLA